MDEREQGQPDAPTDTPREGDASTREGISTVMPEKEAEDEKRTPSPPEGPGPGGAPQDA